MAAPRVSRPLPSVGSGTALSSSACPSKKSDTSSTPHHLKGVDESVRDDVEKLFSSNSVDQILSHSIKLKQEIQSTQDKLRALVGQRYKELLASCEMIVGMRTVCGELAEMHPSSPPGKQGSGRKSITAAGSRGGSSSRDDGATVPSNTNNNKDTPLRDDHAQLFKEVHSIRTQLDQGCFVEAAFGYKQVMQSLTLLKDSLVVGDVAGTALYNSASHAVDTLPSIIRTTIMCAFGELAASGARKIANAGLGRDSTTLSSLSSGEEKSDINRLYGDAHAALELLDSCSQIEALEVLLKIHCDLIRTISISASSGSASSRSLSTTTVSPTRGGKKQQQQHSKNNNKESLLEVEIECGQVVALLSHCLVYLNSCAGTGLTPAVPQTKAMPLENLLALDPSSPDYLSTLTMQVCGLDAFGTRMDGEGGIRSTASGWAMSPPAPQRLQIPRQMVETLASTAEQALVVLIERLPSVDSLASFETSLLPALTQSWEDSVQQQLFDGKGWIARAHRAIGAQLKKTVNLSITPVVEVLTKACDEACNGSVNHQGSGSASSAGISASPSRRSTATLLSSAEALTELVRRKVETTNSASRRSASSGSSSSPTAGGQPSAGGLGKQLQAGSKAFTTALKRTSATSEDTKELLSLAGDWLDQLIAVVEKSIQEVASTSSGDEKNSGGSTSTSSSNAIIQRIQRELRLARIVNLITSATETLTSEFNAGGNGTASGSSSSQFHGQEKKLEELYLLCQECWIHQFTTDVDMAFVEAAKALPIGIPAPLLKLHFADSWTTQQAEGAIVHYPSNVSAPVARALLVAQQSIAEYTSKQIQQINASGGGTVSAGANLRPVVFSKISQAMLKALDTYILTALESCSVLVEASSSSSEEGGAIPSEILMQLYFDSSLIRQLFTAAPPGGRFAAASNKPQASSSSPAFSQLLQSIDTYVEMVDWNLSQDFTDAAVQGVAEASSLSFGCGSSSSSHGSNTTATTTSRGSSGVTLLPEASRLTLLPLEGLAGVSSALHHQSGGGAVAAGPGVSGGKDLISDPSAVAGSRSNNNNVASEALGKLKSAFSLW